MSYIVRYWSLDRRRLIGDVQSSQSLPRGDRDDAVNYLKNVLRLNGPGCDGEVVTSTLPPAHFRHCGNKSKPPAGVNDHCFSCGKLLTVADAQAYDEAVGVCVYKDEAVTDG